MEFSHKQQRSVNINLRKPVTQYLTVQFNRVFAINFNKWGHHGH